MTLIEKKQEEINKIVEDALRIQNDIMAILNETHKISDKIAEIGDNFIKAAPALSSIAKMATSTTKHKGKSELVGGVAEIGVAVIGKGIQAFGDWYAERKKNKLNQQMMPKKQEIARAKKDFLVNSIPKIEKDINKLSSFISVDINLNIIDFDSDSRWEIVNKDVKVLFEAYFVLNNCLNTINYLIEEFNAWLDGIDESDSELVDTSSIYAACVGAMVRWTKIPTNNPKYELKNHYNIGLNLLIFDKDISDYGYNYNSINNFAYWAGLTNVKAKLFPYSQESKDYISFIKRIDKYGTFQNEFNERRNKQIRRIIIYSIILGLIYYIFF